MNPTTLTQAIATIIDESQRLDPDEFADELAAIVDDMTVGKESEDNADDLYLEAIVDGIRWGAQAAVNVELGHGAMLRVCLPDGVRITHEWADHAAPHQAIKNALAAIEAASVSVPEAEQDKLLATAKDVVNLIEGLDGYGLARSVLDETRLKDEPRWVFFFNEVAAQACAALSEGEG